MMLRKRLQSEPLRRMGGDISKFSIKNYIYEEIWQVSGGGELVGWGSRTPALLSVRLKLSAVQN